MFVVGEATIDESVAHELFACDVLKCKGACCSLPGGRGAPLEESEVRELERTLPLVRKYLSHHHLQVIDERGIVEGAVGNRATVCVDDRACVFVFYENEIARCSLEKAFMNGETTWRKPLSCHLFPVRVTPGRAQHLRYEKISECSAALERGRAEGIPLFKFLEEPLTREFGPSWYEEFHSACERRSVTGK